MRKITRREVLVGGAAAAATVGVLAAESCSTGGGPTVLQPAPSFTLTVKYADTKLADKVVRTRTFGGTIPGPTLYALPGQQLSIVIDNQLPPDPPAPLSGSRTIPAGMDDMGTMFAPARTISAAALDPMNNPHLFNTTNLHVHGLQVVPHIFEPIGTSDPNSMMIAVSPGSKKLYNFLVPNDQPPGLYWYHPHHHGSTDVQVSGGMAGLIIVPGPIDNVPEIAAARDIPIAVQSLQLNADPAGPNLYSIEYKAYQPPNAGGYNPRSSDMFVIVNGHLISHLSGLVAGPQPPTQPVVITPYAPQQIQMAPGEVVRLRILNGTNALNLPFQLPGFEVYIIGYDGVNFLAPQQIDQSTKSEAIAAGGRIEMLIRAPQTSGVYTLSALSTQETIHVWPKFDLLQFVVGGSPVSMKIPATLPTPSREYPLIQASELVGTRNVTFNSSFPAPSMLNNTALTVNGVQYGEMSIMFSPVVGTCEKWLITNPMPEGHPFHIHTNSFEVHSLTVGGVTTTYSPPYIADTVWIPAGGTVEMWTRYKQWRGKEVFHCHKLSHEDQGMMANVMLT